MNAAARKTCFKARIKSSSLTGRKLYLARLKTSRHYEADYPHLGNRTRLTDGGRQVASMLITCGAVEGLRGQSANDPAALRQPKHRHTVHTLRSEKPWLPIKPTNSQSS